MGGEKTKSIHPYPVLDGSPPRRRGKVAVNQCFDQALRITPALAGKSTESLQFWIASEDHPRVGGEKVRSRPTCVALKGSPPHGQGKGSRHLRLLQHHRITPAWTGKRIIVAGFVTHREDHPRVGGEKPFLFYGGSSDSGSPPHGRGKVDNFQSCADAPGITPAWAGKSWPGYTAPCLCRDHPRVGREKAVA